MKKIKGYKAYKKGMICRGFKFEEGKTYETDKVKVCESGFHLCTNPLDVLNYYDLWDSEFSEAEALGKIDRLKEDSKIATTKIKIGTKLSLTQFVEASVNFLLKVCKSKKTTSSGYRSKLASSGYRSKLASSGYRSKLASSGYWSQLASSGNESQLASSGNESQLASSGYWSQLASSGNRSQLASSGDESQLELNGQNSVGANIGINGKIKGKKGNWITLAEYDAEYKPICVKSAQIDGREIKEDTWYELHDGEFREVK